MTKELENKIARYLSAYREFRDAVAAFSDQEVDYFIAFVQFYHAKNEMEEK